MQASVCRRVSFENPNAAKVLVCTRFHDVDVTANTSGHWAEVVVRSCLAFCRSYDRSRGTLRSMSAHSHGAALSARLRADCIRAAFGVRWPVSSVPTALRPNCGRRAEAAEPIDGTEGGDRQPVAHVSL